MGIVAGSSWADRWRTRQAHHARPSGWRHYRHHHPGHHQFAILGGFLGSLRSASGPAESVFDIGTIITAIVGALIVLFIYGAVTDRKEAVAHGFTEQGRHLRVAPAFLTMFDPRDTGNHV